MANPVCIKEIQLKNFRCFENVTFSLDAPIVFIEGSNGSGKTSLLEAVHYLCYMRSFRTHIPQDLVHFGNDTFFLGAVLDTDLLTVGSRGTKKQVRINKKPITSYKELRTLCKVITVTQDDADIVTGSPEKRRLFLDHALVLHDDQLTETMRLFRRILETRNAFLLQGGTQDEFEIWTYKLWETSRKIQQARTDFLECIVKKGRTIKEFFLDSHTFSITYQTKHLLLTENYETFFKNSQKLFEKERYFKRSCFGAHLDDIEIIFNDKPARMFSSRGQQKLLTLFLKIAQILSLTALHGPVIFLIDDFLSDFDTPTLSRILQTCLTLQAQIIFTSPLSSGPEQMALAELNCPFLKISI